MESLADKRTELKWRHVIEEAKATTELSMAMSKMFVAQGYAEDPDLRQQNLFLLPNTEALNARADSLLHGLDEWEEGNPANTTVTNHDMAQHWGMTIDDENYDRDAEAASSADLAFSSDAGATRRMSANASRSRSR